MYAVLESKAHVDEDMVYAGYGLGYGNWLHPIIGETELVHDTLSSASDGTTTLETDAGGTPVRRGRGRPRVNRPRDESAVEKRRAQVREAQRAYQKRKDSATASERRRCDDVLQVLSDLSMDVEALLQAASTAGMLKQEGEVPEHVRRLWATYSMAINNPCLGPELRLLQIKNERRQVAIQDHHPCAREPTSNIHHHPTTTSSSASMNAAIADPSRMELDLGEVTESTLISTFSTAQMHFPSSGPRSIYQVCKERRQADFRASQNPTR